MPKPLFRLLAAAALAGLALAGTAHAHPVVSSPNGGELWTGGTQQTIAWVLQINHGVGIMDVDFSSDGGLTWRRVESFTFDGSTNLLSIPWLVPNVQSSLCTVRVCYNWFSSSLADQSDGSFTIQPSPTTSVVPLGGVNGNLLNFTYSFPARPNQTVLTFLSLTGTGAPWSLPGGATLDIVPDALTFALLSIPSASTAVLDGVGVGQTAPFPLPANPALRGTNVWVAGVVFQLGAAFPEATPTVNFTLL